ncbi:hypothetical protein CHS0354_036695 [Potamilus streckersoni]|uniref:RNB domain-containing protein n=1 Tax=Potamilus streckersoni TaxID=2493646 RepID=A0AAE0TGQ1_9BIVA|nr:hypothetical protein CHS0354_036695 [Potamilus streckersoni]
MDRAEDTATKCLESHEIELQKTETKLKHSDIDSFGLEDRDESDCGSSKLSSNSTFSKFSASLSHAKSKHHVPVEDLSDLTDSTHNRDQEKGTYIDDVVPQSGVKRKKDKRVTTVPVACACNNNSVCEGREQVQERQINGVSPPTIENEENNNVTWTTCDSSSKTLGACADRDQSKETRNYDAPHLADGHEENNDVSRLGSADSSNNTGACEGQAQRMEDLVYPGIREAQEGETKDELIDHDESEQCEWDNIADFYNFIGACGNSAQQAEDPALNVVQELAMQAIAPGKDQTAISGPKQILLFLEHVQQAVSTGDLDRADILLTIAYQSLVTMADRMEDRFVAHGYKTCSDLFLKTGKVAMAIRSFYRGIKFVLRWNRYLHSRRAAQLWMVLFGIVDFTSNVVIHASKLLLEELEQISADLEQDRKWNRCCFVCDHLYTYCDQAERLNQWQCSFIQESKKRIALRMTRCAYQMKQFAVVNRNCNVVLKRLCDYDSVEALMLWAKSLLETKDYNAAIGKAEKALVCSTSETERRSIQKFVDDVQQRHKQQQQKQPEDNLSTWLEGTNVGKDAEERQRAKEARSKHVKQIKRHRPKRKSKLLDREEVSFRFSKVPSVGSNSLSDPVNIESESNSGKTIKIHHTKTTCTATDTNRKNTRNGSVDSASLLRRNTHVKSRKKRQIKNRKLSAKGPKSALNIDNPTGSYVSPQNFSSCLNADDMQQLTWSESEEDDLNSNTGGICSKIGECREELNIEMQRETNASEISYFERSQMLFSEQNDSSSIDDMNITKILKEGLKLDEEVLKTNHKLLRPPFYDEEISEQELKKRVREQPSRYKECTFHIESSHLAYCTPVNQNDDIRKIEISGRSKAGMAFSDDRVWVELLQQGNTKAKEMNCFGKVVKIIQRNRKENIKNPVYVCTMDDLESNLMKPICKTVPKINIMRKCRNNNRYRVKLYNHNPDSKELEFKLWFDVPHEVRRNYVFLVVYIGWSRHYVYPRGAVVKILPCAKDLDSGIKLLDIQYDVPGLYLSQTVKTVESIMGKNANDELIERLRVGRRDITTLRTFTIDPPGSKGLDDALSVETMGDGYKVGVHITDVTAIVQKGDPVDMEAQKRTTTFYSGVKSPHHMLPEPFGQNLCSLLPERIRLCISLFLNITKEGKVVGPPVLEKTVIRSTRRFTYQDVQDIINGDSTESVHKEDVITLFRMATEMRKRRLGNSMYALNMELEEETDEDSMLETLEAHYLVEEFMILSNKTVAEILMKKFPNLVPLRCQNAPSEEKLQCWLKRQGEIVDLLLFLQDRRVTDYKKPSLEATHGNKSQLLIAVEQKVFQALSDAPSSDALKYIRTDQLHPLQCLARHEWFQMQERAEYRCSGALKKTCTGGKHFNLDMLHYTHFTSPIRRYVDIIVHRLLHNYIDGKTATYTQKEIEELCVQINAVTRRAKSYQKNCKSLVIAEKLKQKPAMFYGFIDNVTERNVHFITPALRFVNHSLLELPYSLLDISSKPVIKADKQIDRNFVTVEWRKRLYDVCGFSSLAKSKISRIDPNQHVVYVRDKDWAHALLAALKGNIVGIWKAFRNITPGLYQLPSSCDTVEDVSTEAKDPNLIKPNSVFSTTFSYGQVVKVQMTATSHKGILSPCPQLYDMTRNVKCCLQHAEDPVKWLSSYSTLPTKEKYRDTKEYLDRWLPLVLMDAATTAVNNEGAYTINNLKIRFEGIKGQFRLNTTFCFERNIEISGHGAYEPAEAKDTGEDDQSQEENNITSHDWLCIRHTEPAKQGSLVPCSIWVAHGQITKVRERKHRDELSVNFELHPMNIIPEYLKVGRCDLELLMKSDVDRRTEIYLKSLDKATELAKRIALNKRIPKLDKDHLQLAWRVINNEEFKLGTIPRNNKKQHEAISKALQSRFSLIQGPPGTGKSYTGIKLLYHFNNINQWWKQEGNPRKQVLFCGPSNKSVDQVARWMIDKLQEHCPNIVRMYGRSIEAVEFPIPGKTFLSKRSMREAKAAEDIADISLHHLIRKKGKKYAEEINAMDKKFRQPGYILDYREVKKYIHILRLATVDELKKHDVILCTTAVASNAKFLEGTDIYQIIIDEAAMCTEPQCLVPIIATKAEQVVLIGDHKQLQPIIKCREAAELGLKRSLFERYALSESLERNNMEYTLLDIQYRMNPQLCDFPSCEFYEGKLETGSSYLWNEGLFLKMWLDEDFPHVFCHTEGKEEILYNRTEEGNEQSRSNKIEVEQIVKIFLHMVKKERVKSTWINVVSQYNAQCYELREALAKEGFKKCDINVNTVVASQGGEWDYVLFSTVRSLPEYMIEHNPTLGWCKQNLGFITDHHQINVALTRARKGIVIVGNRNLLQCDEVWRRLIDYYENRGCMTTAEKFLCKIPQKHWHKNRQ